jgi:undecaprenyl diphosphate synthase
LFVDCPWPEFDATAFAQALTDYHRRERRFGRIPATAGT